MNRVFRMKFVPTIIENEEKVLEKNPKLYDTYRDEIFTKFLKHQIIGTGWGGNGLKAGLADDQIRVIKDSNDEFGNSHLGVFRAMCSIEKGDLIWVIYKSQYYLFRVKENTIGNEWNDHELAAERDWFVPKDISSYFKGEWIEVGDSVKVPGVVVNSMGIGPTLMELKTAPELSQFVWNQYSKKADYQISKIGKKQIWTFLTDRQIEGVVLTYILFKHQCMVNTETLKHSTAVYECELVDKQGKKYYPQVKTGKTGDTKLCADFYDSIKKIDQGALALVFFENEEYGDFSKEDFECISKDEVWTFMMDHKHLLTKSVNDTLDLYEK